MDYWVRKELWSQSLGRAQSTIAFYWLNSIGLDTARQRCALRSRSSASLA
jgi:hypothetical protein